MTSADYYITDQGLWRIRASFTDPATVSPEIESVPILFFPSPGNGLLVSRDHPCIATALSPCCLLDFAEQYTTIGFYERMMELRGFFNESNCAENRDLRPFLRDNVLGRQDRYILDSLGDLNDTRVEYLTDTPSGQLTVQITVSQYVMQALLATGEAPIERNGNPDIHTELITFVGIAWIRLLHPSVSVTGPNYGFQIHVIQPQVVLDLTRYLLLNIIVSAETNCTLTVSSFTLP